MHLTASNGGIEPVCQAMRRDDTRCNHPARMVAVKNGRLIFTCQMHNPAKYRLLIGQQYAKDHLDLFALSPPWLLAVRDAERDYVEYLRKQARAYYAASVETDQLAASEQRLHDRLAAKLKEIMGENFNG